MQAVIAPGAELVSRYRLEHRIRDAGNSTVFAGYDRVERRRVAIKLRSVAVADALLDPSAAARSALRWAAEGRVRNLASHPNVVKVYDCGTDEVHGVRVDYLVMELLDGDDLAERIETAGELSWTFVVDRGVELADALCHLHQHSLLHRDVKPSNVMLLSGGLPPDRAVLLDLGLCKHIGLATITAPEEVIGTLPYIAPEILCEGLEAATERSDIYSLGVTLHESLAGTAPFDARRTQELTNQILEGRPALLASLGLVIPDPLCAIIECCMQLDPRDRFMSAHELRDALRELRRAAA